MTISKASLWPAEGGFSTAICEKSVVPLRIFQPDLLFRISSAWVCGLVWLIVLVRGVAYCANVHFLCA